MKNKKLSNISSLQKKKKNMVQSLKVRMFCCIVHKKVFLEHELHMMGGGISTSQISVVGMMHHFTFYAFVKPKNRGRFLTYLVLAN